MSPRHGSSIQYDVHEMLHVPVTTRDAVKLATDIYLPRQRGNAAPEGAWPVLMERTPYDKRRPFLVQTARYFARRGYAVVIQDVRGRFASEGDWYFLSAVEGPDGRDTATWIARQPWSNARLGTIGLSYTAANQQAMALEDPPGLAAQFLCDGGYNYFHRTLRHSGAFELGVLLPYAFRMARHGGRELAGDPVARSAFESAWREFRSWTEKLPLARGCSPLALAPSYERWFLDMLTTADYTDAWKHPGCNLQEHVDRYPDLPVFMQTSWYGHHVWATTERYNAFVERHRSPTRMLIGHWTHGYDDYARSWCGEVDFGMDAMLDSLNDLRLQWFDHWLKDLDTGATDGPPISLFVMGGGSGRRNADGRMEHGGQWRDEREWPLAPAACPHCAAARCAWGRRQAGPRPPVPATRQSARACRRAARRALRHPDPSGPDCGPSGNAIALPYQSASEPSLSSNRSRRRPVAAAIHPRRPGSASA